MRGFKGCMWQFSEWKEEGLCQFTLPNVELNGYKCISLVITACSEWLTVLRRCVACCRAISMAGLKFRVSIIHLPTYLPTHPPTYPFSLPSPTHLPTHLPTYYYLPTYLSIHPTIHQTNSIEKLNQWYGNEEWKDRRLEAFTEYASGLGKTQWELMMQ